LLLFSAGSDEGRLLTHATDIIYLPTDIIQ
jgi:hypothetical protein